LPLFRLILTVAFGIIAAKQEVVHEDKYWFFLDEVAKLGDIKLDEVQAQLRKYGVCVAAAIQADKQFVTSMGPDRGATVMNCFGTAALLRAVEPDLAERIAKRLGRQEVAVVSKGQALAVTDWRDGGSLNQGEQERWVVMPTNITRMKDCTAYVRLPGDYPPAFVDYRNWLPKWYRPWARADRFKPKQDMPPRDDRFKVIRAQDQDALASVRAEAEAARQAAAKAAEEAKAAVEKTGVWVVKDLETGELVPAEASESAPSTAPKSSAQENQVVSAEASSAGGLFP
jgi:type IV secretory pathway TraG/TraD family ATPase VirD4